MDGKVSVDCLLPNRLYVGNSLVAVGETAEIGEELATRLEKEGVVSIQRRRGRVTVAKLPKQEPADED